MFEHYQVQLLHPPLYICQNSCMKTAEIQFSLVSASQSNVMQAPTSFDYGQIQNINQSAVFLALVS